MRVDLSFYDVLNSRAFTSLTVMGLRGGALIAKFTLTLFIAGFMGLETLGLYGLIVGSAVLVPVIISLGLMHNLSRNAVTQTIEEVTATLRHCWQTQAAIYAVALMLALCAGVLYGQPLLALIIVLIVSLEHVNDDVFTLLNHLQQPRLANALMFVRTAGWIMTFMTFAFVFPQLRNLSGLLAFWTGGCVATILCFGYATRRWPWRQSFASKRQASWLPLQFRDSRILYFNNLANTIGQYLDRYIVGLLMGLELTGVYVLFWSIGNALSNLISTSVIQISQPKLIRAHSQDDTSYWRLFHNLLLETVLSSLTLAFGAAVLMHFALPYLHRPLVLDWLPVLWLILLGFVLRMAYEAQGIIFYSRYNDRLTLGSGLFVIGFSVSANLALIPRFGLYGAAFAIIASYSVGALVRHIMILKYYR